MTIKKSIFQIEIQDEQYKRFIESFNEYNESLNVQSATWKKIGEQAGNTAEPMEKLSNDTKAILASLNGMTTQISKFNKSGTIAHNNSKETLKNYLSITKNVTEITSQMIKWGSVGLSGIGVASTGFAALKGIAGSESNLRKETKTLGISAGELKSQETNFGKFIDVNSHLHGLNQIRNDLSKRGSMITAGFGGMENLNNSDFLAQSLLKAKESYVKGGATEQSPYTQSLHAMGFSTDELQLLKNTTDEEIRAAVSKEKLDRASLDQSDKQLKSWQDLNIEMDKFTESLKKITADILTPMVKLMNGEQEGRWGRITSANAKEFKSNTVGGFLTSIADYMVGIDHKEIYNSTIPSNKILDNISNTGVSGNNLGNLRIPGKSTGFAQPKSQEEGAKMLAHQLQLYASGNSAAAGHKKLDTIASILSVYAPASENNLQAYINDVSKRTRFSAGQHLDLNDRKTLEKLMSAITIHEKGAKHGKTPEQIHSLLSPQQQDKRSPQSPAITVNNATGGNATIAMSSAVY